MIWTVFIGVGGGMQLVEYLNKINKIAGRKCLPALNQTTAFPKFLLRNVRIKLPESIFFFFFLSNHTNVLGIPSLPLAAVIRFVFKRQPVIGPQCEEAPV